MPPLGMGVKAGTARRLGITRPIRRNRWRYESTGWSAFWRTPQQCDFALAYG